MPRDYPTGFKPTIQAHEMPRILWRFGFENWGSLTALQVGQAMHSAHALRCNICEELVLDNSGGHMVECGIPDHHFFGSQCEYCVEDGIMALLEMAEKGVVELRVSGTPTEKAKKMQFERESADLLDPGRNRYVKVGLEMRTSEAMEASLERLRERG